MTYRRFAALVPTSAFVLLWSSGAIVSEFGLAHASPLGLLIARQVVALIAVGALAWRTGAWLPARGTRLRAGLVGLLMAGVYSNAYLAALDHGVTPGALATLLGVQPILTLLVTERRITARRTGGLLLALAGLALTVSDGLALGRTSAAGLGWAGLSLLGITLGAILQKREMQAPTVLLPLQYAAGLAFTLALVPWGHVAVRWDAGFVGAALWLGLVISVGTTVLLYRLIARGNVVNVTSLLYCVPAVTAAMDWLLLGHALSAAALAGLGLIVAGLALVLRPG